MSIQEPPPVDWEKRGELLRLTLSVKRMFRILEQSARAARLREPAVAITSNELEQLREDHQKIIEKLIKYPC